MVNERQFFRALGQRVKKLRSSRGYTQEDMIGFGFSARHWQQIEAGRPITGDLSQVVFPPRPARMPPMLTLKGPFWGHVLARMERRSVIHSLSIFPSCTTNARLECSRNDRLSTPLPSFRINVVGHNVVVICKLFVANRALLLLPDNLAVEQFPHLRR